jgi:biotin operon repressor
MTQAERDHLVALKKAQKKLITQKQAAEELGVTERHVRRLLRALKRRGDKVVTHGLRGLPSNRRISADTEPTNINRSNLAGLAGSGGYGGAIEALGPGTLSY